jgi:hypothetical protein
MRARTHARGRGTRDPFPRTRAIAAKEAGSCPGRLAPFVQERHPGAKESAPFALLRDAGARGAGMEARCRGLFVRSRARERRTRAIEPRSRVSYARLRGSERRSPASEPHLLASERRKRVTESRSRHCGPRIQAKQANPHRKMEQASPRLVGAAPSDGRIRFSRNQLQEGGVFRPIPSRSRRRPRSTYASTPRAAS